MTPGQAAETVAALEAKLTAEASDAPPFLDEELWDAAVDHPHEWVVRQRGRRLL